MKNDKKPKQEFAGKARIPVREGHPKNTETLAEGMQREFGLDLSAAGGDHKKEVKMVKDFFKKRDRDNKPKR